MSMIKSTVIACTLLCVVGGCESSSDDMATPQPAPQPAVLQPAPVQPVIPQPIPLASVGLLGSGAWTTNDIINEADARKAFNDALTAGTIMEGIPSTANASYNGSLYISSGATSGDILHGRMSMDANFLNYTWTGRVGEFGLLKQGASTGTPTTSMTGIVKISNGVMTDPATGPGLDMTAGMDGTLLDGAGRQITMITTIDGKFYDNAGQSVVSGNITGKLSSNTSSSGTSTTADLNDQSTFLVQE